MAFINRANNIGDMSEEEMQLREELALCHRVCYQEGLNRDADNHLSVALENQEAMLTAPFGVLWSQVKPEDLVLVDYEGKVLRDTVRKNAGSYKDHVYYPDESAINIHCSIHKQLGARAKVVFHTHQKYGTILASAQKHKEIKMVT